MFGFLTRWLTGDGENAPPRSARLRMETLERRDNPALNVWLGITDNFTTASYWSDGVPTPDDILVFRGPTNTSSNPPLPQTGSNTSVTFVSIPPPIPYAADTYAGIRIIDAYSGTLTIPFHIKFGEYTQTTGNTSTPGKNVTIDGSFSWKGGNLNTSSTAGEYRIQGVPTGVIDSGGNAVTTGSSIKLQKNPLSQVASSVEMSNGQYNLINVTSFSVQGGSLLLMAPVPKGLNKPLDGAIIYNNEDGAPNAKGTLEVDDKSTAIIRVKPENRPAGNTNRALVLFTKKAPMIYNEGRVELLDRAEVKFSPEEGESGFGHGFGQVLADMPQNDPVLKIEAGCFITCEKKTAVKIAAGTVQLSERRQANGDPEAGVQPPITITAPSAGDDKPLYAVWLGEGTEVRRWDDETAKVPVNIFISGGDKSLMCDGTIQMYADKGVGNKSDNITATRKVVFGDHTLIDMYWFEATQNVALPAMPVAWLLVESTFNDPGDNTDSINVTPSFDDPPVGVNEAITLVREGAKNGQLKAKRTA